MIRTIGILGAAGMTGALALVGVAPAASAAPAAPAACAFKSVTVPTLVGVNIPPHLRGDRDFKGHGPRVQLQTQRLVGVQSTPAGQRGRIVVRSYMDATETKSDWTRAAGTRDIAAWNAPIGWFVKSVQYAGAEQRFYTDTDHADDLLTGGANSFVWSYRVVGDTDGNEAGTRTRVTIRTKPMAVRLSTCK